MSLLEDVVKVLEEIRDSGYLERFPKLGNKVLNVLATIKTEKPADRDAFDCAIQVLAFNPSTTNATGKLADMIHQYAESYHAKKCAECLQKKAPYKLFGVD